MIRVFLVDDHELFRSGLRSILGGTTDIEVVGEACSGEDAIEQLRRIPCDLVMMDVHMPGIGGIEATRKLVRQHPDIRVIAVTMLSDDPFPNQLLDAGAMGYLSKGCPAQEMFDAIRDVMRGRHYISSEVARKLALAKFANRGEGWAVGTLSAREMQVMLMITQGLGTQEISDSLFLSPKTVSTYRHRLYEKLDVLNDVELTRYAIRHGLIERP